MSSTHIQKRFTLLLQVCLSLWLFLSVTDRAAANDSFTTTISFYAGFDLTSGMTEIDPTVLTLIIGDGQEIEAIAAPEIDPLFEFSPEINLYFGFSADAERPFTVVAEQIKGMIVLEDTEFEAVTQNMLKTLDIPAVTEVMIDQDDLVVLLTQDDQYVLLGSVQQMPGVQVQFTYQTISRDDPGTVPEPGTWLLLGVGLFVMGTLARKKSQDALLTGAMSIETEVLIDDPDNHQTYARKKISPDTLMYMGESGMKLCIIVLATIVVVSLGAEIVPAAELKMMTIGTGTGEIIGEDISCNAMCTKTYEEGTVIHLKANPSLSSIFMGWRVNGSPHEGVIIIDGNTLVQAVFEQNIPDNPLAIFWYNGHIAQREVLAGDEVAIFLDEKVLLEMPLTSEEQFETLIQDIVHQFDFQAEIIDYDLTGILLKLPTPLSREQLGIKLTEFQPSEVASRVGFVVYRDPEISESRMLSDGSILVTYCSDVTDEQILAIEKEFRLLRIDDISILDTFVYQTGSNPLEAIDIANRLYESGFVTLAHPSWYRKIDLHSCPNDNLFTEQWHLNKHAYAEIDLNIMQAWNDNQGEGVVIGIIDSGVDYTHRDLGANYKEELSWDFGDRDNNPFPRKYSLWPLGSKVDWYDEAHGTRVAGLAIADGFGDGSSGGVCGTSPHAKFAALRFEGSPFAALDRELAPALIHQKENINIYNCSWNLTGEKDLHQLNKSSLVENALKRGIGINDETGIDVKDQGGRQGRGNIYVVAVGNEATHLGNDALLNSRFTIPVAASDKFGRHPTYSNQGAFILVNAPSSSLGEGNMVTTDYHFGEYTYNFGKTSAATPLVSGVIALLLHANPELTWRDVQQILISTAERNDSNHFSWLTNGVYPYSHYYGFGRVDTTAAVKAARSWTLVSEEVATKLYESKHDVIDVPENLLIESAEITLNSPVGPWYGLTVILRSPYGQEGTESILDDGTGFPDMKMNHPNTYKDWVFGSVRHFGEPSQGKWQLTVEDADAHAVDFDWKLRFYGTALPTWTLTTPTASTCEQAESGGVVCTFADGSGSVLLQPTNVERPDLQYVFLDADDAESTTHSGTYWFPQQQDDTMPHTVTLSADWLPVPDGVGEAASRQQPCDAGPPPSTETFDFPWSVDVTSAAEACTVRFQWDEQPPVILTLQPPAGQTCDVLLPEPSSGVVTATVSSEWAPEGPQQQVGQWVMEGEPEIVTEYVYKKSCKMTTQGYEMPYLGGSLWVYTCHERDPWPPERPEVQCPPSSPPETLTDPENPPSGNVCLSTETWEDWERCYLPPEPGRSCHLEGGGQYPIRFTMHYTSWVWQTESCEQTYRSDPETVTVSYPSLQDTPPFAGGVSVQLSPRE